MPQLEAILLRIPGFLLAISIHEYAHARIAFELGDDTAEREGRMTLEPWAHFDLVGAIMLLFFRFGWARPVPVNPYRFRNPRKGMALVSLAGPAANMIAAFVLQVLTILLFTRIRFTGSPWIHLPRVLEQAAWINAGLGFFNLIPIPPLDGSKIVSVLLPYSLQDLWDQFEQYGFLVLIVLLYSGLSSKVLWPLVTGFMQWVQNVGIYLSLLVFR
ncbi:MAG TPA: site-2 protease family protein [Firmicutes bacterium]|nr:site-2 protease family protein [Candidatus Fermentithermobacillaceae bacterium]